MSANLPDMSATPSMNASASPGWPSDTVRRAYCAEVENRWPDYQAEVDEMLTEEYVDESFGYSWGSISGTHKAGRYESNADEVEGKEVVFYDVYRCPLSELHKEEYDPQQNEAPCEMFESVHYQDSGVTYTNAAEVRLLGAEEAVISVFPGSLEAHDIRCTVFKYRALVRFTD